MNKIKVLITSAGVASAVNIIKSLKMQKDLGISIYASDADPLASGLFLADRAFISPRLNNRKKYLDFLLSLCKKHGIEAFFPCYSEEIALISANKLKFSEIGVKLLISPAETVGLCDNKEEIYRFLQGSGIRMPRMIEKPTLLDLPVFSKFLRGSGSRGAVCIADRFLLKSLLVSKEKRIFQEYIKGEEFTVDLFCDQDSNLLFAGPRKRLKVKAGQTVQGITCKEPELERLSRKICKAVGAVGICNAQFIKRKGIFYFVEFNPRPAAGGLMLTVNSGANLPLAALKLMLGMAVHKSELLHKKGVAMSRYWEEIIIGGDR